MSESEVICLMVSDLHLSHNPPVARSAESSWYAAMARPLEELWALKEEYDVPILCSGDIFHKYVSPPELINFAMQQLPKMYMIPGQHDIPYHDYSELVKSAYWTLALAGAIEDLGCNRSVVINDLNIRPFPFGFPVKVCDDMWKVQVAVIHSYIWTNRKNCYPSAPIQTNLSSWKDRLKGYDVAVFGDNHKGFLAKSGDCNVINCGCLIRRNIDERDYKPSVGLLHADDTITRHFLDISQDKWIDVEDSNENETEGNPELDRFVEELEGLDSVSMDFPEIIRRFINDNEVSNELVRKLIIKILEET